MQGFKRIQAKEIEGNAVSLWDDSWFLISAGTVLQHNMMTASWGNIGCLWNKPIVTIFVRPSRYTYEFVEKNEYFTLSAFPEAKREILKICGSVSGRDKDKTKETALSPFASAHGSVFFEEAELLIECKKLYFQDLDTSHFLVPEIEKNYADKMYHRMYVGEITEVLVKEP